jgi:2-polyprenyl-3-methyl-5-hydroxy-6-metoxy-1,4-benzoquinol methylase
MKLAAVAENPLEYLALRLNLVPTPIVDTQMAFTVARAIMAGASLGLFDALAEGPRTADEVATRCFTHARATTQLLDCLVGLGYLRHREGRYENTDVGRKWIVRSSPSSMHDKLVFQALEWDWLGRLEDFVRTGDAIDIHGTMTTAQWATYQDGMRALAAGTSREIARKLPVPRGATRMLDIGGSHGLHSVELCRLHPALASTILERPEAIERSRQHLAAQGMGDRVRHQAGNALEDDLGEGVYDLVLISNLVHHFSVEENAALARRVFRALKPDGVYVIGDYARGDRPGARGAIGATGDLYFALTSTSGAWSRAEMAEWQRGAGFRVGKAIRFVSMPVFVCQPGFKDR